MIPYHYIHEFAPLCVACGTLLYIKIRHYGRTK